MANFIVSNGSLSGSGDAQGVATDFLKFAV